MTTSALSNCSRFHCTKSFYICAPCIQNLYFPSVGNDLTLRHVITLARTNSSLQQFWMNLCPSVLHCTLCTWCRRANEVLCFRNIPLSRSLDKESIVAFVLNYMGLLETLYIGLRNPQSLLILFTGLPFHSFGFAKMFLWHFEYSSTAQPLQKKT